MPHAIKSAPAPSGKRVNMQMIALEAGVSATTVSLALRDHASISRETKKRIIRIQQSMGYQSNGRRGKGRRAQGSGLERVIYRIVGLDVWEENYAPFLDGILAECQARRIKLELASSPEGDFSDLKTAGPADGNNRGVILSGRITNQDVDNLSALGLPYIVLGNYRLDKPCHMVGIDILDVTERLMQELVDEGMNRAIFLVELIQRPFEKEFLRCLRGILLDLGISGDRITVLEAGAEFSGISAAADRLIASYRPRNPRGDHGKALRGNALRGIARAS